MQIVAFSWQLLLTVAGTMVVSCDIEFDQNRASCYFSGQLISGTIALKCDKEKDVQAIQLHIYGHAQVSWTETAGFNTRHTYQGREEYLSSRTYLMGSENSSKSTIAVGVHGYTFACLLPPNCPSSFEGKHGFIRYVVKVVLVRPWSCDLSYTRAFTVLRLTDLNFETPQIRIPSNSETYRTFCCGPFITQPLKIELKIPQAGYVPGQSIPVQAVIINNTNIAVSQVDFALVMVVRYISQIPTRQNVERISVSRVKSDGVLRNCTRALRDVIYIPATPPTCLQTCSVMQITYQVEMEVKMSSCQKGQLINIPVIIGNVPLANNTRGMEVIQEQPILSSPMFRERSVDLPLHFEQQISSLPAINMLPPNLPPYSYEESYHMLRNNVVDGEDEQHAGGLSEFVPVYTVYKIPNPTFEDQRNKSLAMLNDCLEN